MYVTFKVLPPASFLIGVVESAQLFYFAVSVTESNTKILAWNSPHVINDDLRLLCPSYSNSAQLVRIGSLPLTILSDQDFNLDTSFSPKSD